MQGDAPGHYECRVVASPLTDEMLRPFEARMGTVEFSNNLTDDEFERLAEWLQRYPHLTLGAHDPYRQSITHLEFLRFFPFIRRFFVFYHSLESLEGLRYLSDSLERLGIGWSRHKLDLSVLHHLKRLHTLEIESQTKHIEVLSELTTLEDLTLRSITLPDLALLLPLKQLLALDLKLGGTKDLALLPRIGRLRYLELWMIKGLTDISAVGNLPHLRYLFLQALRRVETLSDLSGAIQLRRVHLETMKGIRDLRPLATAPALEELSLIDMRHLQPDDLRCLIGLPKLRAVTAGLGSTRKNEAATALLGLPDTTFPNDWRDV